MATVKYRIGRDSKEEIQITAIFTESRERRFVIPTDQKVIPRNWSNKTQEVKYTDPENVRKNKRLAEIKSLILDLWDRYRSDADQFETFKTLAKSLGGASVSVQKKTLIKPLYEKFLKSIKTDLDEKTYRKHLTTFKKVMDYNPNLCFEDLHIDWFVDFRKSLSNLRTKNKETILDVTIQKELKNLKRFLGWASDRVTYALS